MHARWRCFRTIKECNNKKSSVFAFGFNNDNNRTLPFLENTLHILISQHDEVHQTSTCNDEVHQTPTSNDEVHQT